MVVATEQVKSILNESQLNKKSLCDYVINVASGCLHKCRFCYVPSTPVIRARVGELQSRGVEDPMMDWGNYLFVREDAPQQLEQVLQGKKKWKATESGRGVVLLCSGTDPYQNSQTAKISTQCVQTLAKHGKRSRILTRSALWVGDVGKLLESRELVTIGMSIPHLDDRLSRQIEPKAPLPSDRLAAMKLAQQYGLRRYVAMAPTPPTMTRDDFFIHLSRLAALEPEVIFWEPINLRGSNARRLADGGLEWASQISSRDQWAKIFLQQWEWVEEFRRSSGLGDRLHIWVDPELRGYTSDHALDYWINRPTPEQWEA